jgi:hypothetical protein
MLSSRCSHRNCVVRGDSGVGPVRGTLPRVLSRQKVCTVQCVTIQTGKPKLSYVGATFAGPVDGIVLALPTLLQATIEYHSNVTIVADT